MIWIGITAAIVLLVVRPIVRRAVRRIPLDTDLWPGGADETLEQAIARRARERRDP